MNEKRKLSVDHTSACCGCNPIGCFQRKPDLILPQKRDEWLRESVLVGGRA